MKLHLLDRTIQNHHSFNVSHNRYPHFLKIWHYHPELELVAVLKSSGTHFIGDNIERFNVGDVILIGENLPHMWLNDERYFYDDSKDVAEAVGVHFKKNFLGELFLKAPENKKIYELLNKADRGVKFVGVSKETIHDMSRLPELKPFERMMLFIEILNRLAHHKTMKVLSTAGFLNTFFKTNNKRLDKIYEFVYKNFKSAINSKDVAEFIGMNPSAFSRYFKRIHRKTFTTYLNEVRVGYSCKLLLEDSGNISAIAYESGFNNLSNFNRQFRMIMKLSPSEYIQIHT